MKNVFAVTKSYLEGLKIAKSLIDPVGLPSKIVRMALWFGHTGSSKSETAQHIALNEIPDSIYTLLGPNDTAKTWLSRIIKELGEEPSGTLSTLEDSIIEKLSRKPRLIFVDEIDEVLIPGMQNARLKLLLTVKKINEMTGNPFILIGMEQAERKLARYLPHVRSRMTFLYEFHVFDGNDVIDISKQMIDDVSISQDGAKLIADFAIGDMRLIQSVLFNAERIAKTNRLEEIGVDIIKGILEKKKKRKVQRKGNVR